MSGTHDGWQYQGRQSHGWFGNGTKPHDTSSPQTQSTSGPAALAARIHALGATLVAGLPSSLRGHSAATLSPADHARLDRLLAAMVRDRALPPAQFAERFFAASAGAPYVAPFQQAANAIATASTKAAFQAANQHLADGVVAVGMDRWLGVLRAASERAQALPTPGIVLARAPDPLRSTLMATNPGGAITAVVMGTLLHLLNQHELDAAMEETARRFDLNLSKEADRRAAAAYLYIRSLKDSDLGALVGTDVLRDVAAEAVMRAVRASPNLLDDAVKGVDAAKDAIRQAVRQADTGFIFETSDDEERAIVAAGRSRGLATRRIQEALDNRRKEKAARQSGQAVGSPDRPPEWISRDIVEKIPPYWGAGMPTQKGAGWRWVDPLSPRSRDGVRIDQGVPGSEFPSQRVDHVVIISDGRVLGRDGKPVKKDGSVKANADMAHIPASECRTWKTWNTR